MGDTKMQETVVGVYSRLCRVCINIWKWYFNINKLSTLKKQAKPEENKTPDSKFRKTLIRLKPFKSNYKYNVTGTNTATAVC